MSKLGEEGERVAEQFLRGRRYRILARNYRCPYGEIDLIARDGDTIAFVEIKGRRSERLGTPLEAITAGKKKRIARVAQHYLTVCGLNDNLTRFDVVGIRWNAERRPEIVLIKDAFRRSR